MWFVNVLHYDHNSTFRIYIGRLKIQLNVVRFVRGVNFLCDLVEFFNSCSLFCMCTHVRQLF